MNIVTAIPTTLSFVTANVNTEAARRDNTQRETVPAASAGEKSAAETGLGSEADKAKLPGQQPPATYERPQPSQGQQLGRENPLPQDNADDASAGKENAESRQQEQQAQAEQKELEELKQRDTEVRAHENAHATIGGQYAGSPQYEYETGSDGQRYAVGGEVSIDISAENTPEETLRKMQQVKAAALAPAEPSPQDLRVAAEATQKAVAARNEIGNDLSQDAEKAFQEFASGQFPGIESTNSQSELPELEDIIDNNVPSRPNRSLDQGAATETVNLKISNEASNQAPASREQKLAQRVAVIESFYQQVSSAKAEGFRQSV